VNSVNDQIKKLFKQVWVSLFSFPSNSVTAVPLSQSIYTRISLGYIGAIAVGFAGSILGMVIADYYQGKSIEQLYDAQRQSQLFDELQSHVSYLEFQGLRLDAFPDSYQERYRRLAQFRTSARKVVWTIDEIFQFIDHHPQWLADDPKKMRDLLQQYREVNQLYQTRVLELFEDTSIHVKPEEAEHLRRELSLINRSGVVTTLNEFYQDVEQLRHRAQLQEMQSGAAMEEIQGLEKLMIVISMFLSSLISFILAWRTTRSIAAPIAQAAEIAQLAARDEDYSLRVPIVINDEVGQLANSINYFIERVDLRTQQLKTSARNAYAKNTELQAALTELAQTQSQLVQTEKMSSLGQMVAGIAHEINNPVSFIYGNISHAQDYVGDLLGLLNAYRHRFPDDQELNTLAEELDLDFITDDLLKLLTSIAIGADRIREIVQSLRTFSRLDEATIKEVDIHAGIESTLLLLTSRLKAGIGDQDILVIKDYGDLPLVECYANQLNQVILNLLVNAIDTLEDAYHQGKWSAALDELLIPEVAHNSREPGEINDSENAETFLESHRIPQPCVVIQTRCVSNQWVEITVQDNGLGIPEAAQPKLFDPFFTTKDVGRGTGLGLSICYKIITETHQGNLSFQTKAGQGTTFRIQIPILALPRYSKRKVTTTTFNTQKNASAILSDRVADRSTERSERADVPTEVNSI